ncbi:hypothetical protein DFJ58DRAFT_862229 [Suillus subalutaceus]|uniref:uncharacterized protein n=1 Tax=Suillus subalutaceus TaxID=48586 RepID=UPI001B85FED3|nr:uncharacterized protein DFJ58DRAFT_862229 [Suillus subalutaceus]KAG1837700.1 hypothetical protein DFJ58DRAFT_862229 [Suillus subalutaceus]
MFILYTEIVGHFTVEELDPMETTLYLCGSALGVGCCGTIPLNLSHPNQELASDLGRVRRNDQIIMAGRCAVNTGSAAGITQHACLTKPTNFAHTNFARRRKHFCPSITDNLETMKPISPLKPVGSENLSPCEKNQTTSRGIRGMLLDSHIFEGEVRKWANNRTIIASQMQALEPRLSPIAIEDRPERRLTRIIISTAIMPRKKRLQLASAIHVLGLDKISVYGHYFLAVATLEPIGPAVIPLFPETTANETSHGDRSRSIRVLELVDLRHSGDCITRTSVPWIFLQHNAQLKTSVFQPSRMLRLDYRAFITDTNSLRCPAPR